MNTSPKDAANADALRQLVNRLAREVGFDLVAVADAAEFADDRAIALRRIDDGLMDGLPWFTKSRVQRGTDPEALLPGARSIICLGLNYYPGRGGRRYVGRRASCPLRSWSGLPPPDETANAPAGDSLVRASNAARRRRGR